MPHVYARLAGFGHRIVPIAPFSIARMDGDAALRVATTNAEGRETAAMIDVAPTLRIRLQGASRRVTDVCDLLEGPADPQWRVETSLWDCTWPGGFGIVSPEEGGAIPFYLLGPADTAIFVQGPVDPGRFPTPDLLVAEGQTLRTAGAAPRGLRVEVEYELNGGRWSQQVETVLLAPGKLLVVTAQSPSPAPPDVLLAATELARSLRPAA